MNPLWHDEFVALCAIYPSGELTEEEWALLQVHLSYCTSCRQAFEEHQQLAQEVVPLLASVAASDSSFGTGASASSETRVLPAETYKSEQFSISSRGLAASKIWPGAVAAGVVGLACLTGYWFGSTKETAPAPVALVPAKTVRATPPSEHLAAQIQDAQAEIAGLRSELKTSDKQYRNARTTFTRAQEELRTEQAQRDALAAERDQLRDQLTRSQAEVSSLQTRLNSADSTTSQNVAHLVALEGRVHELNASLEEKDRMLALDKEFLDHDREIRDLIGARDLYIADIYDVGQNGKTSKSFGRIFYTKAKSLVFYGYDLDKQPGLKQSVAFQVWGSGDERQNVSLGIFYQDESHKRWVLRFNDSKTLAQLNRVFVTAEPAGGSAKPTGKPLLLAYLQVQPNHP